MKKTFVALLAIFTTVFLVLQLSGCAGSIELNSSKVNHPIRIDGNDDDWKGNLSYLEKKKLAFGFYDDDTSLFLCITTTDRQTLQQILGTGLTVWFDSTGFDDEILGIHFPLGAVDRENPSLEKSKRENPEQSDNILEKVSRQLEIIGPEKDQKREILLPSTSGYNAKVNIKAGKLVYELQIPVIRAGEQGIIGIGFKTPEFAKDDMPNPAGRDRPSGGPPGGGGPGGGPPGGGGGPPGGGGGPPGGGGGPPGGGGPGKSGTQSMPDPLDLWMRVKLSSATLVGE